MVRAAMLLLLAVAVVYGRSLGFGFVYDDRALLEFNAALGQIATLPEALVHDLFYFAEGVRTSPYWRPVITVSYYLDHWIGGGGAAWFHAHNLLILVAGGLGVYRLLEPRWGDKQALLWALLFVLHPLQVELAANVSARTDSYCAAFGIWAMVLARDRPYVSVLLVALACGAKEIGVVVPLACVLWWGSDRYDWRAPVGVVTAWFLARGILVSGWGIEGAGVWPTEWFHVGGRALSLLSHLFVPIPVVHGGLVGEPSLGMNVVGWGALFGLCGMAWRLRHRDPGVSAGIALLVVPVVAAMGFSVGQPRVSEGFLALPLMGAILILQVWVEGLRSIQRPMAVLLLACGAIGFPRVGAWESDATLFEASHRRNPADPYVKLNLARTWVEGQPERALDLLGEIGPMDERREREAAGVRGRALLKLGRKNDAIPNLLAAVAPEPEAAWATGMACVLMAGRGDENGWATCEVAVKLLPLDADVANAMGVEFGFRGEHEIAGQWFERAVGLAPASPVFRENLQRARSVSDGSQRSSDEGP